MCTPCMAPEGSLALECTLRSPKDRLDWVASIARQVKRSSYLCMARFLQLPPPLLLQMIGVLVGSNLDLKPLASWTGLPDAVVIHAILFRFSNKKGCKDTGEPATLPFADGLIVRLSRLWCGQVKVSRGTLFIDLLMCGKTLMDTA